MKHKTAFILIGLLFIGIAAYFYIDNIFLPVQFKRFITIKAEKLLHRRVSVETVDFRPIKGFLIQNISVSRKDDPAKPFIQIDEITFNLLLAPIFRKKAVILPTIKIKNPYLYLSRDENKVWNFSDLSPFGQDTKNPFSVLLRKLVLEGGKIQYTDTSQGQTFFESIEDINLYTTLSLNKGIRFIFQAQVPKKGSSLKLKGNYSLLPNKLTAQVLLDNIHLAEYLPLSYTSQPYLRLSDGIISSADFGVIYEKQRLRAQGSFLIDQTILQAGENREMSGTVFVPSMAMTWQDNKWNAEGQLQFPSVRATFSDSKEFQGDVKADLNLLTISGNRMTSQGDVAISNAHLKIGENKYLKGNITATNASLIKGDGKILLQGNFDIAQTDVRIGEQISLTGNLSTTGTNLSWSHDESGANTFNMQSGLKMDNARAALGTNRSISSNIHIDQGSFSLAPTRMAAEARGQLDAADISFAADKHFKGSPSFDVSFEYNPENKDPLDYKGTFRFADGTFAGIPYLDAASHINGTFVVEPDQAQTSDLTLFAQETNFRISGLLMDFAKPRVNLKASSESIDLKKALSLFPSFKKKLRADITGKASAAASYTGLVFSPSDAEVAVSAQLIGATLIHEKLPEAFTEISGQVDYKKDFLKWSGLTADYKGTSYLFNGQLTNFSRPTVDTEVTADRLKLNAQVKILHSAFQLTSFTGTYLNSSFDLKGDAHLPEDASLDIDLRGTFTLDLKDTGNMIPQIDHRVKTFNPSGILAGEGVFKGTLKDWRNWQLALDLKSDKITLRGYPLENVSIRFTQRDATISKCNGSAKIYGGDLTASSSADLRQEKVPFTATISLKDMDLARLREDKKPKNRQLAGTLSSTATLAGAADQWREMTGEGSFGITKGHIWQWDILTGLSNVLLIPEFKNLVFTEAHGDFLIGDRRVSTNNAQMISQSATLDGKGWIDFHKTLNFNIKPTFSKVAILKSDSLKKGPTSVVTQTEGYLNIKLTGTLGKPHFTVEKSPLKILEGTIGNTTNTIKEVIGGVIGEVFK